MSTMRTCCNCVQPIPLKGSTINSVAYRRRMYCSSECSTAFRRRERNRLPHPPEVVAELARRDPSDQPSKESMQRIKVSASYSRYLSGVPEPT